MNSQSFDLEQQTRVAFLRGQAQFLLYVFYKTEVLQSQAPFEMCNMKKRGEKHGKLREKIQLF